MNQKPVTFKGVIMLSPNDFSDIVKGETTIGFKYDGIGCVLGFAPMTVAVLLNLCFYAGKFMLLHSIFCVLAGCTAMPIAIWKKDYETYFIRRYLAIIGPPIVAAVWFVSGGVVNAIGFIWMTAMVSYNSFLVTGKKGKWYVSYAIAVNAAAMLLCRFCPQLLVPVQNEQHLIWQSIFAAVTVCAYIGTTIWFQRKIAENVQDKLATANKDLQQLNREIQEHMHRQMEMKLAEEKLKQEKKQAEETALLLVHTLADTIETRDRYLRGHSGRVSEYSALIASGMGLPEEQIARIKTAATLHDVGKIGVPDTILNKPGRLTDEEYSAIKDHCRAGANLLRNIDVIAYAADIAEHHHERYDGRGYPDGLKGEAISLDARIVALADSFDAMNSKRVYRDPLPRETIRSEIVKNRGTQFDPQVADAFLALYDAGTIDEAGEQYDREMRNRR